jgi:hypothetical protein
VTLICPTQRLETIAGKVPKTDPWNPENRPKARRENESSGPVNGIASPSLAL